MNRGSMTSQYQIAEARRGEWENAAEFLRDARALIENDMAHEALYDGLRSRMIHLLRSGAGFEQAESWRAAMARAAALVKPDDNEAACGKGIIDARLHVLIDMGADLVSQIEHFSQAHLKDQPHFRKCLEILKAAQGELSRSDLLEQLGLKQANGTRVLKILESERLVRRERRGSHIYVLLLPQGQRALVEWARPNRVPENAPVLFTQPIPGVDTHCWTTALDDGTPVLPARIPA